MKKHRITKYMTLQSHTGALTFGWRCRCGIPSRRFGSREARSTDIANAKGNHKSLRN